MSSACCFIRSKAFLSVSFFVTLKENIEALVLNFGLYQKKYANAEMQANNSNRVAVVLKINFMKVLLGLDA